MTKTYLSSHPVRALVFFGVSHSRTEQEPTPHSTATTTAAAATTATSNDSSNNSNNNNSSNNNSINSNNCKNYRYIRHSQNHAQCIRHF